MKLTLIQNAYDFLSEALSKALIAEEKRIQWKYAVLNLVQAIELLLKERLRQEHPALIYQDIEKQKNTVNLDSALQRLEKVAKIDLSISDIKVIKKASKLRNEIVHSEHYIDEREAKAIFAKLLSFANHFHSVQFDSNIHEYIDNELWHEAIKISEYADQIYKSAQKAFKDRGVSAKKILSCPNCEWETFVIHDLENKCYVCGYHTGVETCDDCGRSIFEYEWYPLREDNSEYKFYCKSCVDKIIDEDHK